jgi:hypothetical protein
MDSFYIHGEIEVRPAVPARVLAGTRFTASDLDGEVFVIADYHDDHSLIVPGRLGGVDRLTGRGPR